MAFLPHRTAPLADTLFGTIMSIIVPKCPSTLVWPEQERFHAATAQRSSHRRRARMHLPTPAQGRLVRIINQHAVEKQLVEFINRLAEADTGCIKNIRLVDAVHRGQIDFCDERRMQPP